MKIAHTAQQTPVPSHSTVKWYQDPRFWLFMLGLLTWVVSGYMNVEKDSFYLIP